MNKVLENLKTMKLESFEQEKITKITGKIPLFKFDYELNLKDDLKKLGIKDVFTKDKADLTNITSSPAYYEPTESNIN